MPTISHNTNSINALIMGPIGHEVGNAIFHGFPLTINETFPAAGEYDAQNFPGGPLIFLPAANSTINRSNSSLRNRHAQANIMKGTTITTVLGGGQTFQKYTHGTGVFGITPNGNLQIFFGDPQSADNNFGPNPGQPSAPCRMSAFQAGSGTNKHYGTVYNFDGNTSPLGQTMVADITMPSAGNFNNMNPVSMGVSAGV